MNERPVTAPFTFERSDEIQLELGTDILSRLQAASAEAAGAKPPGEMFGILVGGKAYTGKVEIEIVDFVALWRQQGGSPLSRHEMKQLSEVLDALAAGPLEKQPVGFFRTHTAEMPAVLDAVELQVAQLYFPAPGSIFLVIASNAGGAGTASFWFRDRHNEIVGLATAVPLPSSGAPAPASLPAWRPERPQRFAAPTWPSFIRKGVLAGVALVALGAAAYFGTHLTRQPSERGRTAPVAALTVERDGAVLKAKWNRAAPAFNGVKLAILLINDGYQSRAVNLDISVDRGEVIYAPSSDDVEFRLRLVGEGEKVESVRVLGGQSLPSQAVAAPFSPSLPGDVPGLLDPAIGSRPDARFAGPPPGAATTQEGSRLAPRPRAAPTASFRPPQAGAPASIATPPPPAVEAKASLSNFALPTKAAANVPGPPPPSAPQKPPANPSAAANQPAPVPLQVTSPVPLRAPALEIPPRLRPSLAALTAPVLIDVGVEVDASGSVSYARVLGVKAEPGAYKRGLPSQLSDAAMASARAWKFEPAKKNGQPVAGSSVVTVRFTPPGTK